MSKEREDMYPVQNSLKQEGKDMRIVCDCGSILVLRAYRTMRRERVCTNCSRVYFCKITYTVYEVTR